MFQNFIAVCKSSTEMKRGSDFYSSALFHEKAAPKNRTEEKGNFNLGSFWEEYIQSLMAKVL